MYIYIYIKCLLNFVTLFNKQITYGLNVKQFARQPSTLKTLIQKILVRL